MSLCCTVGYKWANVPIMDCIKLEFNDIIALLYIVTIYYSL